MAADYWHAVQMTTKTIFETAEIESFRLLENNQWENYFLVTQASLSRAADILQDLLNLVRQGKYDSSNCRVNIQNKNILDFVHRTGARKFAQR